MPGWQAQSYSRQVLLHLVQRKNRTSLSSALRSWRSHQYAILWPQSGHRALVVGRPADSCSSTGTTRSNCLVLLIMDSPDITLGTSWPHFLQTIMPPLGIIMLLHLGQNSIK